MTTDTPTRRTQGPRLALAALGIILCGFGAYAMGFIAHGAWAATGFAVLALAGLALVGVVTWRLQVYRRPDMRP